MKIFLTGNFFILGSLYSILASRNENYTTMELRKTKKERNIVAIKNTNNFKKNKNYKRNEKVQNCLQNGRVSGLDLQRKNLTEKIIILRKKINIEISKYSKNLSKKIKYKIDMCDSKDEIIIDYNNCNQFLKIELKNRMQYAIKLEEYFLLKGEEIDFYEMKILINDSLNDIETQNWNYLTTNEKKNYTWKGTLKSFLDIIIINKECLSYLYPPFYVLCKIVDNEKRYINYECKSADNLINYGMFLEVILTHAKRLLPENKLDSKINIDVPCISVCIKIINYLMLYIIFEIQGIYDTTDESYYRQLSNFLRKNKNSFDYISNERIGINFLEWKENKKLELEGIKFKDFLVTKNDQTVFSNQKSFNAKIDVSDICRTMLKNFYEMRNDDITGQVDHMSKLFNESFDKNKKIAMCVFFVFLSKDFYQCYEEIMKYKSICYKPYNDILEKDVEVANSNFYRAIDSFIENIKSYYRLFYFSKGVGVKFILILDEFDKIIKNWNNENTYGYNIYIFFELFDHFLITKTNLLIWR